MSIQLDPKSIVLDEMERDTVIAALEQHIARCDKQIRMCKASKRQTTANRMIGDANERSAARACAIIQRIKGA